MHKSVLVVEDDKDIRESIRDALEIFGVKVHDASHGQEALDLLDRIDPPCVILLDLMMPIMNGQQFYKKTQSDPRFSNIPVIVISADGNARQKAASMGVTEGIAKPIDIDTLYKIVCRYCEGAA